MSYERYRCLAIDRRGKVLVISFNRPESLNTITAELHRELSEIFADVARDADAGAVVLTGNGRAFSAPSARPQPSSGLSRSSRSCRMAGINPRAGSLP